MKKIFISFIIITGIISSLSAASLNNIYGTWVMTSKYERSTTVFGKDIEHNRGGELTLEFNKQNKVRVNETGSIYYFYVKNGKLYFSDKKSYIRNSSQYGKKYHIDVLKQTKSNGNCIIVKYDKKGLNGYYKKEGYKMCKVENHPQPTFNQNPYQF
jgi:hypothetical protein